MRNTLHYTRVGQWQPVGLSPFCKAPWPPVKDSVSERKSERSVRHHVKDQNRNQVNLSWSWKKIHTFRDSLIDLVSSAWQIVGDANWRKNAFCKFCWICVIMKIRSGSEHLTFVHCKYFVQDLLLDSWIFVYLEYSGLGLSWRWCSVCGSRDPKVVHASSPGEVTKNTLVLSIMGRKIPLQNMCHHWGPHHQHRATVECSEGLPGPWVRFGSQHVVDYHDNHLVQQDVTGWNVDDNLAVGVVLLLVDKQEDAMVLVALVKTWVGWRHKEPELTTFTSLARLGHANADEEIVKQRMFPKELNCCHPPQKKFKTQTMPFPFPTSKDMCLLQRQPQSPLHQAQLLFHSHSSGTPGIWALCCTHTRLYDHVWKVKIWSYLVVTLLLLFKPHTSWVTPGR